MKTGTWIALASIGIIGSIGLLGSSTDTTTIDLTKVETSYTGPKPPSAASRRDDALKFVRLDAFPSKGGFGSVLLMNGFIHNLSPFVVRDPKITCQLVAPSGTSFGSATATLYEWFNPGKTIELNDLNFGFVHSQAYAVGCKVTDLIASDAPAPELKAEQVEAAPVAKAKGTKTTAKGAKR